MNSNEKEYTIGLWGTSRTGKTTFVSMLYHTFAAEHVLASEGKGAGRNSSRAVWTIEAKDVESLQFAKRSYERIYGEKRFPEKTCVKKTYKYTVTKSVGGKKEFGIHLEILDAPGEVFEALYNVDLDKDLTKEEPVQVDGCEDVQYEERPRLSDVFDYLNKCDGLIVMLDPSWQSSPGEGGPSAQKYSQLLWDMFFRLSKERSKTHSDETNSLLQHLALCVSKVDATPQTWKDRTKVIESRETCYMNPQFFTGGSQCDGMCPVYRLLGERFMRDDLPHLYKRTNQQSSFEEGANLHRYARCFTIGSIGRNGDEGQHSNFGSSSEWLRDRTPAPVGFSMLDDAVQQHTHPLHYLTQPLDDVRIANEAFRPSSINNHDNINPYGLIEPIEWLVESLRATP